MVPGVAAEVASPVAALASSEIGVEMMMRCCDVVGELVGCMVVESNELAVVAVGDGLS